MQDHVQNELCVALVVHRAQGATVERVHALEDGGGRELAYVKMSRARQRSSVYVVADSVAQAAEDLRREWTLERRLRWAIDVARPATARASGRAAAQRRNSVEEVLRRGRLHAERRSITASMPPDPSAEISAAESELDRLRRRREDLKIGQGPYANHPVGRAMREHERAQENVRRLEGRVADRHRPRKVRRNHEAELMGWQSGRTVTASEVAACINPESRRLDKAAARLTTRLQGLYEQRAERDRWHQQHPEAVQRVEHLHAEIAAIDASIEGQHDVEQVRAAQHNPPWLRRPPALGRTVGLDR